MRCHMSALNCAFRITGLTSSILGGRRPISRVLSWTVIHLGPESLQGSSNQPAPTAGSSIGGLFGLAPGGVYLAANCYQTRGALLPHPFTLTGQPKVDPSVGGLLSAALAVGSRRPDVIWHLALWSPDFPPPAHAGAATVWPSPKRARLSVSHRFHKLALQCTWPGRTPKSQICQALGKHLSLTLLVVPPHPSGLVPWHTRPSCARRPD